jgi:hypothetical protein
MLLSREPKAVIALRDQMGCRPWPGSKKALFEVFLQKNF